MSIKINQIAEDPRPLNAVTTIATGSGKGGFIALDMGGGLTEGAYVDESGNVVQITEGGVLKVPATSGEANTASNLAGDQGIFAQKNGVDLQFKALSAGSGISLSSDSNKITITATGGSSNEFLIELDAVSGIANKIAGGTIPIGITAVPGDDASVDATLSGTSNDLVLIHNLASPFAIVNTIRQAAPFFTGFQTTNFPEGDIQTDPALNQVKLTDYETVVGSNGSKIFLKIV